MDAINEIYAAAGIGAAELEVLLHHELALGGAPNLEQVAFDGLGVDHPLHLAGPGGPAVAQNPVDDIGWTKVQTKKAKKVHFSGTTHKKMKLLSSPFVAPQEERVIDIEADENTMIWVPKTSSRRAAMKWSMARKGWAAGTPCGMAYFIYGSYGPDGVEY